MIPDKTLQEIQGRLDIVEVIGGYLALKKAGRNFKALCPFHPEKTPSFMVYPHKQFFICYGCGAGGDLIAFVMRHERLEFSEAVELLASKAGVAIETRSGRWGGTAHPELYEVHEWVAQYYHELLLKHPQAEAARAYLTERGLTPETWKALRLGFAPDRWDTLLKQALEKGVEPQVLERAGLAVSNEESGRWFDRFRARVIFPIWDGRGRVIAFGGRVLAQAQGPKYMNSPETELYVKGRVLYGLHLAVPHIREKDFCIVVEGYMDWASPYQNGICNIVASMGTSLTEMQVRLIRRHTRHVVMVYDGDYAGQNATLRGLDLFLEAEMRVKVAALPSGLDPDSLVRTQGIGSFAQVIRESQDLFDYKLNLLKHQWDPKELAGRVQISQEMLPTIKRVPNTIQRGEYVRRLSEVLNVGESLLWGEMARIKRGGDAAWQPTAMQELPGEAGVNSMSAEGLLAGLLLEEPPRVAAVAGRLDLEHLQDADVQKVVRRLVEAWEGGFLPVDHRALLARMPEGELPSDERIALWLGWADSVAEKELALDSLLKRIKQDRGRAEGQRFLTGIREAEKAGDAQTASRLVLEYNRFMKEQMVKETQP